RGGLFTFVDNHPSTIVILSYCRAEGLQCRSAKKFGQIRYGGVNLEDHFSYLQKLYVTFTISVETTHLWKSNYSPYQEELFTIICDYKDSFLTSFGYRKISKLLNENNYLTPTGKTFKPNHVFSIYKKGKIRLERMNRPDIVVVSPPKIESFKTMREFIDRIRKDKFKL
ncbi:MAG: hypothetical protein WBN50_00005, partial [Lutimonas sp.]